MQDETTYEGLFNKYNKFLKKYYPEFLINYALKEEEMDKATLQTCVDYGYTVGSPDFLVFNKHRQYSGLAVNIISPGGKLSETKIIYTDRLRRNGWYVINSGEFEELLYQTFQYAKGLSILCSCKKHYIDDRDADSD